MGCASENFSLSENNFLFIFENKPIGALPLGAVFVVRLKGVGKGGRCRSVCKKL